MTTTDTLKRAREALESAIGPLTYAYRNVSSVTADKVHNAVLPALSEVLAQIDAELAPLKGDVAALVAEAQLHPDHRPHLAEYYLPRLADALERANCTQPLAPPPHGTAEEAIEWAWSSGLADTGIIFFLGAWLKGKGHAFPDYLAWLGEKRG